MDIDDWRRKIDSLDAALLRLLNQRFELAIQVGRLKHEKGLSFRAPEREQQILSRMKGQNPGPLSDDAVGRIYRLILDEAIRAQKLHCERPEQRRSKKKPERR